MTRDEFKDFLIQKRWIEVHPYEMRFKLTGGEIYVILTNDFFIEIFKEDDVNQNINLYPYKDIERRTDGRLSATPSEKYIKMYPRDTEKDSKTGKKRGGRRPWKHTQKN